MAHAERCPICNGQGKIRKDSVLDWEPNPNRAWEMMPCHGCGGVGWITVYDEIWHTGACICAQKGKTSAEMPCPIHG